MDKIVLRSVRAGLKHSSGCFYKPGNGNAVTGISFYFSKVVRNLYILYVFISGGRKENVSCVYRLGVLQFDEIVGVVGQLAFCSSVVFRVQFLTGAYGNKNRCTKVRNCSKRCAGSSVFGRKQRCLRIVMGNSVFMFVTKRLPDGIQCFWNVQVRYGGAVRSVPVRAFVCALRNACCVCVPFVRVCGFQEEYGKIALSVGGLGTFRRCIRAFKDFLRCSAEFNVFKSSRNLIAGIFYF